MIKFGRIVCVMLVSLFLVGCKTELYSNLQEREGNAMLAILLQNSIDAEKVYLKGNMVTLRVNEGDLAQAIMVLQAAGYPKPEFRDFCEVFKKDGLISSPVEERARVVCATTEDLSATLSQLDGVIQAKVHVVMPQTDRNVITQSSASVMIKHAADVNLQSQVPQVKLLVANSIPELDYDNITVALFPSSKKNARAGLMNGVAGNMKMEEKLAMGVGLLLLIVGAAWFFIFMKDSKGGAALAKAKSKRTKS